MAASRSGKQHRVARQAPSRRPAPKPAARRVEAAPAAGAAPASSRRTQIVWGALVGAMVLVAGGLSMVSGGLGPRGGRTLPPMMSAEGGAAGRAALEPAVTLDESRWDTIVIHHSAAPAGCPEDLDRLARQAGLDGLGYHFVIGNGRRMDDGAVHVGYRWVDQLPGAHVAGDAGTDLNRRSIGICLVGDGDRASFSDRQLARLEELVGALADRCGIAQGRVILHRDTAQTSSPGRYFPETEFREQITGLIAR